MHFTRADDEIAAAALSRMSWDSSIPWDAVKVKVENGYVTLTGKVDWRFQQQAAAAAIRSLGGVIGVSNQLTIKGGRTRRPSATT